MIFIPHDVFVRACVESCRAFIHQHESHHKDATFRVGHELKGFSLFADNGGWIVTLNGVKTSQQFHLAAPLANLQAAVIYLTSDHG